MHINIRELFSSSLKNIYQNKRNYLLTTIILQLFIGTVGRYSLAGGFRWAMNLAGESNLNQNNIWRILNQTGPFLILTAFSLLVVCFILFEFAVLIYMVGNTYRSFSFKAMLRSFQHKLIWLSGPQLLFFLFYLILMIPLGNLGLTTTLLQQFRIPSFITGELTKTALGTLTYYGVLGLVFYLNIRLIYFLPLSVINTFAPWTNFKQSWQLTKRNKWRLILTINLLSFLVLIVGGLIVFAVALLLNQMDSAWNNITLQTFFYSFIRGLIYLMSFLFKLIIVEILINYLVRVDKQEEKSYFTLPETEKKPFHYPHWVKGFIFALLVGFIVYNGLQLYLLTHNNSQLMIAHRGDITTGVENSLEALEGAHKAGADLVEMDVLMTADNQFIVIHDNHLERLAGLNWLVSEKTLAELEGLTITQGEFQGKISSLETYVKRSQELGQPLLIELKPHGGEPDNYADLVIAELERLKLGKSDKIMSLDVGLMKTIEKKARNLTTGQVISLQFGNFEKQAIDFYVIEDFSYNEFIMLSAQHQNKELFVWTINDSLSMSNYLQSPVNGIITDELGRFKEEQEAIKRDNTYFDRVFRLLSIENW